MRFSSILTAVTISICSSYAFAEKVTIYTEEFPPFNFTENGKIVGASTEIVNKIMVDAGVEFEIQSLSWARAYNLSQNEENAFIYSISRRKNREDLFQWVGELVPANQSLFTLSGRDDVSVSALEDIKNYRVGTTIEDSRESYLSTKGFDVESFSRIGGDDSYKVNYEKLKNGRIDIWPMPDAVASYVVKKEGDDPKQTLKKLMLLDEISQSGYYLAASKSTSPEMVAKIKAALDKYKETAEYKEVVERWGL